MPILISGDQRAAPAGAALLSVPVLLVTVTAGPGIPSVTAATTVDAVSTSSTLAAIAPAVSNGSGSVFGGNFGGNF